MDPSTQSNITYIVVTAMIAGIAWIAKSIVKPWSDAALMRSAAFVAHVEKLGPAVEKVLEVYTMSSQILERNTVAMNANTEANLKAAVAMEKTVGSVTTLIDSFGSDPKGLCKINEIKKIIIEKAGLNLTDDELAIVLKMRETTSVKK